MHQLSVVSVVSLVMVDRWWMYGGRTMSVTQCAYSSPGRQTCVAGDSRVSQSVTVVGGRRSMARAAVGDGIQVMTHLCWYASLA